MSLKGAPYILPFFLLEVNGLIFPELCTVLSMVPISKDLLVYSTIELQPTQNYNF